MKTIDLGNGTLVEMADAGYYFSVRGEEYGGDSLTSSSTSSELPDEVDPETVGGYKIVPEGTSNNLPKLIRNLLDNNHQGKGVLNRLCGLHLGQGPAMYKTVYEDNQVVRKWDDSDSKIKEWLNSWDVQSYIARCCTDLVYGGIYYSKMLRNVGGRLAGRGVINELAHECAADCRREWPEDGYAVRRVLVGDWDSMSSTEVKAYRRFDPLVPFSSATTMDFAHIYQYGRNNRHPVVPGWYGSRFWMKRSSDIPTIMDNLINKSLNLRWHIISPKEYWDEKEKRLKEQCLQQGKVYKPQMIEEFKDSVLKSLSAVLSGIKNVGKFFHSESVIAELGVNKAELRKWEIVPIDMKIDKFLEAEIKVADKADQATASGMGLHAALSNIVINGRTASGSEELYALKIFMATDTWAFDQKLYEVINKVIKAQFPNSEHRIGSYHDVVMKEQNVNQEDRLSQSV